MLHWPQSWSHGEGPVTFRFADRNLKHRVVEVPKIPELLYGKGMRTGWIGPGPLALALQCLASCYSSVCYRKSWEKALAFFIRGWLGKLWYIHTAHNEREFCSVCCISWVLRHMFAHFTISEIRVHFIISGI